MGDVIVELTHWGVKQQQLRQQLQWCEGELGIDQGYLREELGALYTALCSQPLEERLQALQVPKDFIARSQAQRQRILAEPVLVVQSSTKGLL